MSIGITNNYSSVYDSTYAAHKQQAEKKEAVETSATQKSSGTANSNDYLSQLAKLAPSVDFRVGGSHATDKSGRTLTIDPNLLAKMQSDPKMESEMKEMIKGVEYMTKLSESYDKAFGYTTVFQHSYIDANGRYSQCAYVIKKDVLNEKLRKEAQEDTEKLIERTRKNTREKTEQLRDKLKEKAEEAKESGKEQEKVDAEKAETEKAETQKAETDEVENKAETLLQEKIENSEDGNIFFDDDDMQTIIEAMSSEKNPEAAIYGTRGLDIRV